MRRLKKRKPYHALKWLYRSMVAIASIILVTYFAVSFAIKPPEIPQPNEDPSQNQPEAVDPQAGGEEPHPEPVLPEITRKSLCYTFLLVASDHGNGNADTIMVMTFDIPNEQIGVVSIPRDTVVETKRKNSPKINAAYAKGVKVLRDEVSNLVGFPIDFYVTVDMEAFVDIVDAIGGIEYNVPVNMDYFDPADNLKIQYSAGYQHLSGKEALEVARFRKGKNVTGYDDNGRMRTQQGIIKTVGKEILSWGSITKVNRFVDLFMTHVKTDLDVNNMIYFAGEASKLNLDTDVKMATLPGDGTKRYKGFSYCYGLYSEKSLQILNDYVNPYKQDLTMDDVNFLDLG